MIDWYVILFMAIAILIFYMGEIAGHSKISDYLQQPEKNKVSAGTESMLLRLLTGTFVFIPVYLTVSHGYLAGLILSITGTAVLFWFSVKISKLNDVFENRTAFFKARTTGRGRVLLFALLFVAGSEGLLISTILANSFMEEVFGIQPIWTSSILCFFVFVFAGMGGAGGVQKIGRWLLFGFFTGITILPFATILIHGVSSVHEKFNLLLVGSWNQVNLFVAAFLFIFFIAGQLLVYYLLSADLLAVKQTRLKTTIGLTAICWSSMPIAVSVVTVYLMSYSGKASLTGLFTTDDQALFFPLSYVLVVSALSCFALSLGVSLYQLTSLLMGTFKGKSPIRKGYTSSLIICVAAVFVASVLGPDILAVFTFYINLFISLSLPLYVMISSSLKWGWELSVMIIASAVLGIWLSVKIGILGGVGANLGFTVVVLVCLFIRKIRRI
jgi:hypothetical protein